MPNNMCDTKDIIIILLVLGMVYLLYKTRNLEHFSTSDDINQAINDIYKADVNAIRNLSNVATEIKNNNDSFTIPAKITKITDLNVDGNITFTNRNTNISEIFPKGMIVAWYDGPENVPKGWAYCDGKKYKLDSNYIAQEVILTDTTGTLTPDLRGRTIIGAGNGPGLTPRQNQTSGGEENHTLTINEIPAHDHGYLETVADSNGWWYDAGGYRFRQRDATSKQTGGGMSHNNMQPFFILGYILKL